MKLSESQLNKIRKKYKLTQRESEIVKILFLGIDDTNEIAQKLGIAIRTVKVHLINIYRKNNVNSKLQLLVKMFEDL